MKTLSEVNYNRIAEAIEYLSTHFKSQPTLDEVAEKAHISSFHFQRLFTEWAGVSPKKFLQYISIQYAKQLLKSREVSLFEAANDIGLSGTGRLHDLFVKIEGMTPGEYKNGGANLYIYYSYAQSPFGELLIASTSKGICHMAFAVDREQALAELKYSFPNAQLIFKAHKLHEDALMIFNHDKGELSQIKLHLKGTVFQLKVWEALLKVPFGHLCTYGEIAQQVQSPMASRAVGSAIGNNPVAFLIPCHRVIQSSGVLGGYMWGPTRKKAIIGWEAAQSNPQRS